MFQSPILRPVQVKLGGFVVAVTTSLLAAAAASASVNLDWATVGNAGNAGEIQFQGTFGAVAYTYRIGAYEVTNAQYAVFLNAVAASDPNGLYNTSMGSSPLGGITRSGLNGSYTYAVKANMGNKPVNYVSWFDAARMSNWMTNGQGSGGTESGVYTLTGPTSISAITRDPSSPSQVFIPTEDEWYKAAYHHPAAQGGDSDDYWLYATQSNAAPTIATATGSGNIANPGANVANHDFGAVWNGQTGNVTTVGSAGNTTFYGAFDMNGNVWEWNESLIGASRGLRGGSWAAIGVALRSSNQNFNNPAMEFSDVGFRLASHIPGPDSAALLAVGALLLTRRRR